MHISSFGTILVGLVVLFGTAASVAAAEPKEIASNPPPSGDVAPWVDDRVEKLAPTAEEKR